MLLQHKAVRVRVRVRVRVSYYPNLNPHPHPHQDPSLGNNECGNTNSCLHTAAGRNDLPALQLLLRHASPNPHPSPNPTLTLTLALTLTRWPWQRTANRPAAPDALAEPVEEGVSLVHRVLSRMMRWWGGKVVRHPYKILSVFGVATVAFTVCATMLGDPDSATGNPFWPKSHRARRRRASTMPQLPASLPSALGPLPCPAP